MTSVEPVEAAGRPGPSATFRQSATMAWRQLVRIKHNPMELLDLSLMPIMFLLIFVYVFGGQMMGDYRTYLQYVLGGMIAQNAVFATMNTGLGLNSDLRKGVYDRFRSLPIARSAPLAGRILSDLFKQLWAFMVMVVLGVVMGFEVQSLPGVLGAAGVLLVFSLGISWFAVLIGIISNSEEKVQIYSFVLVFPLTFTSSVFVDIDTMPGWLQAWAKVNPITHLADALRGLLSGGPVASPVLWTVVWAAVIFAVFAPLAMRAYRRKTA
ncbi:ABC transporter permease [Salininema proteolyticum]|uniref:Transport permease protein n=1 Tax=Salininema proteolyticum TaxID=1607685 RepID=A0ABV8TVL5_9ACTN